MKIEILYEDPQILAVAKPAGLPVHATHDDLRANLQGLLEKQVGRELVLFHRLDLDTTGVVLFGRDRSINKAMTDLFRDRKIQKTYWAVVEGRWPREAREIHTFIKKGTGGRWLNVPSGKGGDPAHSQFRCLESIGERSLLEVLPQTGRTHQIRLHCLSVDHVICGDRTYGKADPRGVPMALHARRLRFRHPTSGAKLCIEAPLPDHWRDHWLRGFKTDPAVSLATSDKE